MKKVWVCVVITLSILLFGITNVQAVSSIEANISCKDEKVNGGQEVIITLKLEKYIGINKGINAYKAKLEYNSNVFEKVKESDFIGLNDWEEVRYNENNGEFIAIKKAGSKLPEDVMQITLRVKQDAKHGKDDITIKEISYSEGEKDSYAEDVSKSIEIIKDSPDKPDTPDTPSNPEEPEDPNIPSNPEEPEDPNIPSNPEEPEDPNIPSNPEEPEDPNKPDTPDASENPGSTNKRPDRLPNTGSTFTGLFILIAIAIIIAIISYTKYIKIKKEERKINKKTQMFITILCVVAISSQLIGTTYAAISKFLQKGDIDLNDQINIYDVRMLEEHLIGLNILTDKEQLENAEISGDGKITITDLTLLIRKIEDLTKYQVELEKIKMEEDNYYPTKNQEIVLSFSAKINPNAYIQAITINNKEYSIKYGTLERQNEDNNTYRVKLNSGETAGVKKYNLTKVLLNTGKEVELNKYNYTIAVNVLKEEPSIKNYKVVEENENAYISFDLIDTDNSIINNTISKPQITISRIKEDQTEEIIKTEEIVKGNQTIEVKTEPEKNYQVKIEAQYNLAPETDKEQEYKKELKEIKTFKAALDYRFTISNIKTVKDGKETTTFSIKEPIQIVFESTNTSNYKPQNIKVDGKIYPIIEKDGKYTTTIDAIEETGEKIITIEAVILSNGKEITIEKDNTIKLVINKRAPKVTELNTKENVIDKSMKISFNIEDPDNTIQNAQVILYDSKGNIIIGSPAEITSEELKNGTIEKFLPTNKTDKYTVKIVATYKITEEETVENAVLIEQEIEPAIFVDIIDTKLSKNYVEKGENVSITYKIETNSKQEISKILVNSIYYNAEKITDNEYSITVPVGNEAKLLSINTTEIILEDETSVPVKNEQQVDVLKANPRIEEIRQEDDINSNKVTVTFKLVDPDEALIKTEGTGTVRIKIVKLSDNEEIINHVETTIDESGNGRIVLEDLEEETMYVAKFIASYNRYNNDSEQLQENQVIATDNIELIRDYKLQVSNIKTSNSKGETTNFEKGEHILLSFESTNVTEFKPSIIKVNGTEYDLTEEDNKYIATLEGLVETGEKTITIEAVILSNGREFVLERDNTINIIINKTKPTITNFETKENISDNNIKIKFNVEDEDKAIQTAKIELYDSEEKIIGTPTEIKTEELENGTIEKILQTSKTDKYKVKVIATYKLSEENIVENSTIFEQEVEAEIFANITEATTSKNYAEKNENVDITYKIETNSQKEISKILVNNAYYKVTKNSNGSYTITLSVGNEAKLLSLKTTEVMFDKEKIATVENELEVYVLKDKPRIEEIHQEDDINSKKVTVKFNIVDTDEALVKTEENELVRVELVKAEEIVEPVETSINRNGESRVVFENLEEEVEYIGNFIADYNRYHNTPEQLQENQIIATNDIKLLRDYNLQVSNIKTSNQIEETTYFEKGEKILLSFECTNSSEYEVSTVKIDGIEYTPTREENRHTVTIAGIQEIGEKTFTIESVKLSNDKEIALEKDNTVNIAINKTIPIATITNTEENANDKKLKVNVNIEDADKAIQTAKIELYDSEGKIIGTPTEITPEELAIGKIEKLLPTGKTDQYNVKVIATYKLAEGNIVENSILSEQKVEAIIFANISEAKINKEYVEKGQRVNITYKIETNSKERITKVYVNDTYYQVTRNSDGYYTASVPVGDEAKLLSLKTTKLFFSNEIEIAVENEVQVDILKEEPKLEQIAQANNSDPSIVTVTFKVIDPDGALIKTEENALVRVQIAKSSNPEEVINTITASVEENGDARIDIKNLEVGTEYVTKYIVSYNRYHNTLEKLEENKTIATKNVEIIGANDVRVLNIRTCNNEKETKYFKKNEDLIIELECLNNTDSQITHLILEIGGIIRGERLTRVENTNIYRLTLHSKERNFVNIRSKKYKSKSYWFR